MAGTGRTQRKPPYQTTTVHRAPCTVQLWTACDDDARRQLCCTFLLTHPLTFASLFALHASRSSRLRLPTDQTD